MATPDPLLIDFDAFRAEQQARPLIIRVGGQDYALPSSPPASVALDGIRLAAQRRDDRARRTRWPASPRACSARRCSTSSSGVHRLTVAELQALITPGHGRLRRRGQPTPKPGEPADAAPDPFDLIGELGARGGGLHARVRDRPRDRPAAPHAAPVHGPRPRPRARQRGRQPPGGAPRPGRRGRRGWRGRRPSPRPCSRASSAVRRAG